MSTLPQQASSVPRLSLKQIGLGLLLLALGAVAALAVVHEIGKEKQTQPVSAASQFAAGLAHGHEAPALSAEEEAYAVALWPIHSDVKLAAIRMTFAGITYKTQDSDAQKLKVEVQPLTDTFRSAARRARQLQPPATLAQAHADYLQALDLYSWASKEMIKVADDGSDGHLVAAHRRSEEASTTLIKLSDTLWPGEYKPN
jgi:hypothetical protein